MNINFKTDPITSKVTGDVAGNVVGSVDSVTQTVGANVTFWQGIPQTAVNGKPNVHVSEFANNAITANAIASNAITNAKIADGAIDVNKAPSVGVASSVLGSVGSVLADVTVTMTQTVPESYSTASGTPTLAQILHEINQTAADFGITYTTLSFRNKAGSTAMTFTLDDGTNPTSRTRTT